MIRILFFLFTSLLLTSCRTSRQTIEDMTDISEWEYLNRRVTDYEHTIDSLSQLIISQESHIQEREERDSTYNILWRSDTLIVQDSTYVREFPDGSTLREFYHSETRILSLRDTLYKDRVSFEYLADLYAQYELNDHLQRDYSLLLDSFTYFRDSVSAATHTDVKVVSRRDSLVTQVLAIIGAISLVSLLSAFLFNKFVRHRLP